MINSIVKFLSGKEIILFDKHRQTLPLLKNNENRKKFIFLQVSKIWSIIPFKSSDKRKHRVMYFFLSVINPKYIISINWISTRESLYKVWTKSHPGSKFIVVQHGSYVGGVVTDIAHRYTKCDIFLTWSDYFTRMFREYNQGKNVKIITFGNTVYNEIDRAKIEPKNNQSGKVLLIPSPVTYEHLPHYERLIEKLKELGFSVYFKPHSFQHRAKYATIKDVNLIEGDFFQLLMNNDFEFIISDKSTALLDAIFHKNRVLYFSPQPEKLNAPRNYFDQHLQNIYFQFQKFRNKDDINVFINLITQETLINSMHKQGDNRLETLLCKKIKNPKNV